MKGIHALQDTYSATGEEIRKEEQGTNADIIRLKGKAAYLKKNVDEVSANLVDLEKRTEAKTDDHCRTDCRRSKTSVCCRRRIIFSDHDDGREHKTDG